MDIRVASEADVDAARRLRKHWPARYAHLETDLAQCVLDNDEFRTGVSLPVRRLRLAREETARDGLAAREQTS